jgi:hypothetical protein
VKGSAYLLLGMYMLLLSLLPCGDRKDCAENTKAFSTEAEHHDHDEDSENCSPFCICACCSMQVDIDTHMIFIGPAQFGERRYFVMDDADLRQRHSAIWQPPKQG